MTKALLFLSMVAWAGCTCSRARAPAPTPSLTRALELADRSVGVAPFPDAQRSLERVASELEAWALTAPELPRVDATALGRELRRFAREELVLPSAKAEWRALRGRFVSLLRGEPPGPPPRFRRDLPDEVRAVIAETQSAFDRFDLEGACSALDQVTLELSQFSWSQPPPRSLGRVREATERLDRMPESCRQIPIAQAREQFDQAVRLLAPAP